MCTVGNFVTRAEFERLERQIATLRAQTPVRIAQEDLIEGLIIMGGQTMASAAGVTTYGIEKYAGTLSGITVAAYDPGTVDPTNGEETAGPTPARTAWPSGLGFATAQRNGVYSRVIVVNDSRGGCSNALVGGDSSDTTYAPTTRQARVLADRKIVVTMADGTYLRAWSPKVG